ncbi:hypothetical protein L6R52_35055 [Myxococcota bacterium]|nr:hypothetical protein [Myxococcota bacterium]
MVLRPSAVAPLLVALAACGGDDGPSDVIPEPPLHTPLWAFEPWISKDISSTDDTYDFVRGFQSRDIPVGVVVLDSPWETNYNSFVPHPVRYHDFDALVRDLRDDEIRTVLWITQMVNEDSFDLEPGGDVYAPPNVQFLEAQRNGYCVDGGAKYFWWKGTGCALDFMNDAATKWWHAQQDRVLDAGIAGWKLDFGDSYVTSSTISTAKGVITHQQYSEAYYRDFLAYGVHRRGAADFLTMVRAWDASYQFEGRFFARPEHAPVAWMGDNRRDWIGLEDSLDHMFRSAKAGYVVLGSDIGGYLDRDDLDFTTLIPFDVTVFARWTAVSAMTPFMQLHGRANITPWTVPERADEIVELYRYWSVLHSELAPFFYSLTREAYASKSGPIVHPQGDLSTWPGDYRFVVGEAFLVAPILDATGVRAVELPSGARWIDWWSGEIHEGGTTITASVAGDLRAIPLFVREGAIVPARVARPLTGLGTEASAGKLTLSTWPGPDETTFTVHPTESGPTLTVTAQRDAARTTLSASSTDEALVLRVALDGAPSEVTENGAALVLHASRAALETAGRGAWYDADARVLWIFAGPSPDARTWIAAR